MKVLILKPRLDLPFKKFAAALSDTNLPEIRTYWEKFVDTLAQSHRNKNDDVVVVEAPRWQFTNDVVKQYNADRVYVPHTEEDRFKGGETCMYYMQSVFPELFTIDSQGWGGGATFADIEHDTGLNGKDTQPNLIDDTIYDEYKKRIENNKSKFAQPDNGKDFVLDEEFIFVPLQLPHDETIKYHSDVDVPNLVASLCHWSSVSKVPVIFKGHPINRESMEPLKEIIKQYSIDSPIGYVDDIAIHKMLDASTAVYVINSGVGMEAMLHNKPIVSFGRSEYQKFVIPGDICDLDSAWNEAQQSLSYIREYDYKMFFDWYVNKIAYNCNKLDDFS